MISTYYYYTKIMIVIIINNLNNIKIYILFPKSKICQIIVYKNKFKLGDKHKLKQFFFTTTALDNEND